MGDIDSEGRVNLKDISHVSRRFRIAPASDLCDPNADTNSDVKIDLKVVGITAKQFEQG